RPSPDPAPVTRATLSRMVRMAPPCLPSLGGRECNSASRYGARSIGCGGDERSETSSKRRKSDRKRKYKWLAVSRFLSGGAKSRKSLFKNELSIVFMVDFRRAQVVL